MAPVNFKLESSRLEEAKKALEKLKKRRGNNVGAAVGVHQKLVQPDVKSRKVAGVHMSFNEASTAGEPLIGFALPGALKKSPLQVRAPSKRSTDEDKGGRKKLSKSERASKRDGLNGHCNSGKRSWKNAVSTSPPDKALKKTKAGDVTVSNSQISTLGVSADGYGVVGLFESPNPPVAFSDMTSKSCCSEVFTSEMADSPFLVASRTRKVYSNKRSKSDCSTQDCTISDKQPTNNADEASIYSVERDMPSKRTHFKMNSEKNEPEEIPTETIHPVKAFKKSKSLGRIKRSKEALSQVREANLKMIENLTPNESQEVKNLRPLQKVKKFLGIKTKKRPDNAPMSIKMNTSSTKSSIFVVTECESKNGEMFDAGVSKMDCSDSPSKFIVTTVPETMVLIPREENIASSESEGEAVSNEESHEESSESGEVEDKQHQESSLGVGEEDYEEPTYDLNDRSKVEFHFVGEKLVLKLQHPASYTFCGHVEVQVLKGAVEILGFLLTPSSTSHSILSPLNKPLMTLQTVCLAGHSDGPDLHCATVCAIPGLHELIQQGNPGDVFILMKKVDKPLLSFLEQCMKMDFLPHPIASKTQDPLEMADHYLQSVCMPLSNRFKTCDVGANWCEVFEGINKETGCSVLTGGKGVGKSTLLRFLVNRYLSSGAKGVLVLDFDPGQAEFTVPGCVSATVVKKPLLGPNYYNQQDPVRCIYLGEVNVINCMLRYLDACFTISSYMHSDEYLRTIPCLVNTMGFTEEGLGVPLMVHILSMLQPSSVIQIQCRFTTINFPLLSDDFVKKQYPNSPFRELLLTQGRHLPSPSNLNYDLHITDSKVTGRKSILMRTKELRKSAISNREVAVMSYMSRAVLPPDTSLLQATPYGCLLDALYLHVCHESLCPSVALSTFNGSMVALCHIDPEKEDILPALKPGLPSFVKGPVHAHCAGFGVVRGIDMDMGKLFLTTPVLPNILSSINCLVLGAVNLPSCVYRSPPKVAGHIPYVMTQQKSVLPSYL